jgi:hypothetical protein
MYIVQIATSSPSSGTIMWINVIHVHRLQLLNVCHSFIGYNIMPQNQMQLPSAQMQGIVDAQALFEAQVNEADQ